MAGPVRLVAGRYQLRELLGRGGMGCVWRAEDELLRRPVAVKEIAFPPSLSEAELAILQERTLREARAAARIDSPAAVRVYDVVEDDGRPCIVMELVEGRSLRQVIRDDGPLTPAAAARVGLALVDALEAAHAAGIVHRDVKPGNVLLRSDGRVTLTDFGIARTAGDPSITSTGLLLGSPSYISPERAKGGPPLPASDMWSLGATLFTAVEGRPPFDRGEPFSTLAAVVGEPAGPYLAAGPLAPVIDRLLDKDPAGRPTPAGARSLLAAVAADPANDRPVATTATVPLGPAEHTIVLPPAPATPPVPAAAIAPPTGAVPRPVRRHPVQPTRAGSVRRTRAVTAGSRASERLAGGLALLLLLLGLGTLAAFTFLGGGHNKGRSTAATTPATSPTPRPTRSNSSAAPSRAPSPAATPAVVVPAGGSNATSPTPTGAGTSPAAPTLSPSAGVPAGWVPYTDPAVGWTIYHPPGWVRRVSGAETYFQDPTSGRYVQVDSKSPAGSSAVGDWLAQEQSFQSRYPGYSRIQLQSISVPGYSDAAVWEFTYPAGGTTLHAIDYALVRDNRGYAVLFQTPASAWAGSQGLLQSFLTSFRPAG